MTEALRPVLAVPRGAPALPVARAEGEAALEPEGGVLPVPLAVRLVVTLGQGEAEAVAVEAPAQVEATTFPADPVVSAPVVAEVQPVLRADPQDVAAIAAPAVEPEDPNKPKRKGWWSLGR